MATASRNKGNGKIKVMMTDEEFNTLTIALALLSVTDMETEMQEQGLNNKEVEYNHLKLFDTFTKVNKLYVPKMELEGELKQ